MKARMPKIYELAARYESVRRSPMPAKNTATETPGTSGDYGQLEQSGDDE